MFHEVQVSLTSTRHFPSRIQGNAYIRYRGMWGTAVPDILLAARHHCSMWVQ